MAGKRQSSTGGASICPCPPVYGAAVPLRLDFDHAAVAVRSIRAAVPLFRDALGGEYLMGGEMGDWRWIQFAPPTASPQTAS